MTLICKVSLQGVSFDSFNIQRGERIDVWEKILGVAERCQVPKQPAPYGHRNNVIYCYDHLGLVLNENHATFLIQAIQFNFETARARFTTLCPFSGELYVCGVPVRQGMRFDQFAAQCTVGFQPHLGHAWFSETEDIALQFEVKPSKGRRGLERGTIQYLEVSFRHAYKLTD